MSEAYIDILERFVNMQDIMMLDDKEFRKNPRKTARIASLLVMASLYSKFALERQYQVFKAMKQSMREKLDTYKALGDTADDIAATLIYASEVNKTK